MNFNDLVRINDTAPILRMTAAANNLAKIEFGNSTDTDAGKLTYGTADDSLSFTTNTAERARFTSAGILLVGKTSTSVTVTGCSINPNGQIYNIVDTPAPMGFHVRNNSGTDSTAAFACYSGLTTIGSYNPYGGAHPVIINLGTTGEKLRLDAQGDLGIGVTNPLEKLHVAGNIIATGNITAYYSDERLKDFKGTIPNALDKVGQLNGYYYTPNETAQALGVDNNGVEVGVSAQEVEAVLPEIVTKSAIGDDYKTVYYEKITPLLIEAVKELTQKVEKLELRLNEMGE